MNFMLTILLFLALSINDTKLYAEGRLGKEDLRQYCNSVVSGYVQNMKSGSSSSSGENFGAGGSYAGIGANVSYGTSNSQSEFASNQARKNYAAYDCSHVLKTYGDVTIAEINADRDTALGRMQLNAYLYEQDTLRAIEELKESSYKYGKDIDASMNIEDNAAQIMQTELNTRHRPYSQVPDYNAELTRLRKRMRR